jgi:hypothetical protein
VAGSKVQQGSTGSTGFNKVQQGSTRFNRVQQVQQGSGFNRFNVQAVQEQVLEPGSKLQNP